MKNSMRWYLFGFVVLTVGAVALAGERTFLGTVTSAGPAPYYANNDFYIPPNSKLTLECTAEANVLTDTRYVKNSYDYDALCPMRCKGVRVPANMMFQTSVGLAVVSETIVLPDGGYLRQSDGGQQYLDNAKVAVTAVVDGGAVSCDVWRRSGTE